MTEFDHLEERGNMIIPRGADFSGERFDAFKNLASSAKADGALIVAQINHPGRLAQSRLQKAPISASDVVVKGNLEIFKSIENSESIFTYAKPHAASQEEINQVIEGFAHAAEYLEKAGWDGIQIQGAHGFLLSQFFSSVTNLRTDKYGGSLKNRIRLIVEIADACRERVSPSFIIGIKINSVDFQNGFTVEEAQTLCESLEEAMFDYVELSGGSVETNYAEVGGHRRDSTTKRESFFLDFAQQIVKPLNKTKTYVTGGFKTVGGMTDALKTVDGVGMVRAACQEPHLPKDILEGKVTGAIKRLLDDQHWGITTVAAGSQIRQLGKDEEPFDQSIPANNASFLLDFEAFMTTFGKETDQNKYGFLDLSQPAKPYYGVRA